MSHSIHVNLFVKTEMRSAAPVRGRIMALIAAGALAGTFGVFALVLRTLVGSVESDLLRTDVERERLDPQHKQILSLQSRLQTMKAGLSQLGYCRAGRLAWGETLTRLPSHVPGTVQFLELRHFYPPHPQSAPGTPLLAPTNRVETGRLVLNGRTTSSDSVAELLASFRRPPLDTLLSQARIPPGAFRQEPRRPGSTLEALLFEIEVECPPRRFE